MVDTTVWREVLPPGGEVSYRMEVGGEHLLSWYVVYLPLQAPTTVLSSSIPSSGRDSRRTWCTWCDRDDCPHTKAVATAQDQHLRRTEEAQQPAFHMMPVVSSNIATAGYDAARQVLRVQYMNRNIYEYANVPASLWEDLQQVAAKRGVGGSVGSFIASRVKGRFSHTRLEGGENG